MQKKLSVSLKDFSAIRIGGLGRVVYFPETVTEFAELLTAKPGLPVIGGGTNVFFGDVPELVCTKYLDKIRETPDGIEAECGAPLAKLFDFAAGVPATVGGGIAMNFGAFGFELKDFLVSAQVCSEQDGIKTLSADELRLGYRTSDFQGVVLSALFRTKQLDKTKEFLARRKDKMPWGKPNLGSIFKNPPGLSAGQLLDDAGLKAYRHKDLQVSAEHANIIINNGAATAEDLLELIEFMRGKVKEKLELEIKYLGGKKKFGIVGVLMGGVSSEREISLRSGKNIADALRAKGYAVKEIDITSRDCAEQLDGIDAAYNILHGAFGEDGGIQEILEKLKIPYTGSGVSASQNCMHKVKTKIILEKNNLPTPKYQEITAPEQANNLLSVPCVVKAASEGSSIGVTIVKNLADLAPAIERTLSAHGEVFIEEFISGAEVTVGVLPINNKLTALPILELRPKNEFYDFESKYTPGGTEFVLPAELAPSVTELVQTLAVKAYQALNCAGAARVDFVLQDRKQLYILEINTVPGMTDQSDLPAEAKALGIEFPDLVEMILLSANTGKL